MKLKETKPPTKLYKEKRMPTRRSESAVLCRRAIDVSLDYHKKKNEHQCKRESIQ